MDKSLEKGSIFFATFIPFLVAIGFLCYETLAVFMGTPVSLTVRGYDPADILRGQYILYTLVLDDVNIMEKVGEDETIRRTEGYLSIIDSNGDGAYNEIGGFYWNQKPPVYIKAECTYHSEDYSRFRLVGTQGRYYLDEKIAKQVEDAIAEAGSFQIHGTVIDGLFRATSIEVDGVIY